MVRLSTQYPVPSTQYPEPVRQITKPPTTRFQAMHATVCKRFITCLTAFIAAFTLQPLFAADNLDWTYWRGPESNGISRETGLPDTWDPEGENVLWKRADCGSK